MNRRQLCFGAAPLAFCLAAILSGCSSGSSTHVVSYAVPANVALTPVTTASLDVGATLAFSAQAENNKDAAVTQPITYFSSNPAVVTVAASGIACAGSWDSISSPQVCTPGPVGTAQITASAQGVSSPPTTVYVHQHIDSIVINPLPVESNPTSPCITKGQTFEYAAMAYSGGADITTTVGQFTWSTATASVVTLSTPTNLLRNQVQATAGNPGLSSTFASISGVNSAPFNFITCPVQSITLSVNGISSNPIILTQGLSQTVRAVVTDSLGNIISAPPLTWSSSEPSLVAVTRSASTQNAPTATISASGVGGGSVVASCTPPTCNVGFQPSLPIYANGAVGVVVTPNASTSTSTTATTFTLDVTTSDCQTTAGCTTTLVPITTPANTLGAAIALPSTPNSFIFSRSGGIGYLGTDLGDFGTAGLMRLSTSGTSATATANTATPGKAISVSPDGTKVVVADTADPNSPPQVFIFDTTAGTDTAIQLASGTTNVAADFSPDSLKAFIVASVGSSSTLYIYSKIDALQTIPLAAAAQDVAFEPSGNFGYIADEAAWELSLLPTCDNPPPPAVPPVTVAPTIESPFFIRPLTDGKMLTVESSGIELFTPTISGTGCAFPRPYPVSANFNPGNASIPGDLTVTNHSAFFNLGQGNFVPRKLIVSADGSTAYILANDANNNPLGVVIMFNVSSGTSSAISLAGNAIPLDAALTPDGTVLYVGASDGTVHAVSTVVGGDFQQIQFPLGLCRNSASQPFATPCNPDLLAIAP
jgi:hypothetical protein